MSKKRPRAPLTGQKEIDGAQAPKLPRTNMERDKGGKRVIVFLDQASLETVKTAKGYELLSCDDHRHLHKKFKRNPADSRPDICHQTHSWCENSAQGYQ